jgi:MerR family transcriptional regulator, light-induced transcriptional regulator
MVHSTDERDEQPEVSLTEAAELLGVHYMTAYRYVRTGRLAARKVGSEWRVNRREVDQLRAGPKQRPARGAKRSRYPSLLEDRLVAGDEAGAWTVIDGAMAAGMEPEQIYLELLGPVLSSIGDRWERNELTVDQEHLASNIALRVIGRLGPRFARRGRRRGSVVLGAPPGDSHGIPLHLAADLLRAKGFEVTDLGADVPAPSFAHAIRRAHQLVAVGVCATTTGNEENLAEALVAARAATEVPIVVGGGAIESDEQVLELGGSLRTSTALELVDAVDEIAAARTN